jgi:intracellular multiplication protein IcmK
MGSVAWRRPTALWVAAALLTLTVPVAAVAADDPGDPAANAPAPVTSPVSPAAGATGPQARREQARERAFEQTEDATVPMTPEQLQSLIQSLDTAEAISSAHRPPETVMTAEALDLNATRPPVVRVGQGYGTSLLFTDRTGKAWPITAYQGFNDQLFVVSASTLTGDKEDLPSVLVVQPVASRGAGNLVVTLKGLETPIVLTLALGQNTLDARKEFKLPLAGPNAAPEYRAPSPRGIETGLLNVLNGLPPTASATRVEIRGVEPEALAWRVGKALYLRTVAEVYSPEYRQRASHPSGLHAYQLPDVPVLLVSFNGHLTELTLQE